ncbi:hypothetical protein X975_14245, partial [Stegodyphus mimosarum]
MVLMLQSSLLVCIIPVSPYFSVRQFMLKCFALNLYKCRKKVESS